MHRWIIIVSLYLALISHVRFVQGETTLAPGNKDDNRSVIACKYELSHIILGHRPFKKNNTLYLWRQPDQIEKHEIAGNTGEIWTRSKDGDITYQRVFHNQKRVIEYTSGDLKLLHSYPEWNALVSVVDLRFMKDKLKESGKVNILGREAYLYKGQINGVDHEVIWLEEEHIPALVRQVYPDRIAQLRLIEVHSLNSAPWKRYQTDGYVSIDYADIGDNEADPFIQQFLKGSEDSHAH